MGRFTLTKKSFAYFFFVFLFISPLSIAETLDSLIRKQVSQSPNLGIHVKNITDGKVIVNYKGNKKFTPASNQKIVTTISSLHLLGKNYRFKTIFFLAVKKNQTGEYNQDFFIDTKGDPTLKGIHLRKAVMYLKEMGVKSINGNIVVNNNYYEKPYYNRDWNDKWKVLPWAPYVSSIAIDGNYYSSGSTIYLTDNPLYLLGVKFKKELKRQKIKFNGTIKISKIPIMRKLTPFKIKYESSSAQLSTIVGVVNKKSNNLYAEHLFKKLSANFFRTKGSWINSRKLVKDFLINKIDLQDESFTISDGSGLSSKNKISPAAMVKILEFASRQNYFDDFYQSLAIGGIDGTLVRRFKSEPLYDNLRAKTGYIYGVSSLSGYFRGEDDDLYAFSIIVNDYDYSIRPFIDKLLSKIYYF